MIQIQIIDKLDKNQNTNDQNVEYVIFISMPFQ